MTEGYNLRLCFWQWNRYDLWRPSITTWWWRWRWSALLLKIIEDDSIQGHDVLPWHHFTSDSTRVKYIASDIKSWNILQPKKIIDLFIIFISFIFYVFFKISNLSLNFRLDIACNPDCIFPFSAFSGTRWLPTFIFTAAWRRTHSVEKTGGCLPAKELNKERYKLNRAMLTKEFPRNRGKDGEKTKKQPTQSRCSQRRLRDSDLIFFTIDSLKKADGISRRYVVVVLRTEDINYQGIRCTKYLTLRNWEASYGA